MSHQNDIVAEIVKISREFGGNPQLVLGGGGNTSAKNEARLWVKASGVSLGTIDAGGFVEMDRAVLNEVLGMRPPEDAAERTEAVKQAVLKGRVHPELNQRPSVEVVLHNLVQARFVVHTHPTLVNMVTCCIHAADLVQELFGDAALYLGFVEPGLVLAQTLDKALKEYSQRTGRTFPTAVIMENHGLIVAGESRAELEANTQAVLTKIEERLKAAPGGEAFGPVTMMAADPARAWINVVGPALRGLMAGSDERLAIARFEDGAAIRELVGGARGRQAALDGPLTPDQMVYCGAYPLWVGQKELEKCRPVGAPPAQTAPGMGDAAAIVEMLRRKIGEHAKKHQSAPIVVLVEGLGMFTCGPEVKAAETARAVYVDAVQVMAGASRLGGIRYLSKAAIEFIENWEVESYRKKIAAGAGLRGRVGGKVALVTGAAQGFGREIAQDLVRQGACVALLDLNAEGVRTAAEEIANVECRTSNSPAPQAAAPRAGQPPVPPGPVVGLAVNVTQGASVAEALHQVVRAYGGLDVLVSNAGVLKAGSVKTQPEKDFEFVTAVNYKGYFVCVQQAAGILATQHLARPGSMSDIIQINSKSGLQGSNKNGAYAGSKFGGIGLTQSFALELIEDGVKVNAICPGNFFDGPLWSDPRNGLFVQYLNSGKVPGAKTMADVKKFYESKVPMGRGCTTADVMKAVYYLIEQKYETGQAVPVTGGQVMLS